MNCLFKGILNFRPLRSFSAASKSINLPILPLKNEAPVKPLAEPFFKDGFWVGTRFFSYSPRKLRMMGNLISGMTLNEAARQMQFSLKKPGLRIVGIIRQAAHLAQVNKVDPSTLYIAQAIVGRGPYRKMIDIRGRGKFGMIKKPKAQMKLLIKENVTKTVTKIVKVKKITENPYIACKLDY